MELWDAYYANGTLAGFDLIRGEAIPEGFYHQVCNSVIKHEDGTYLMMQRSLEKEILPGKWEIGQQQKACNKKMPKTKGLETEKENENGNRTVA